MNSLNVMWLQHFKIVEGENGKVFMQFHTSKNSMIIKTMRFQSFEILMVSKIKTKPCTMVGLKIKNKSRTFFQKRATHVGSYFENHVSSF